MADKLPSFQFYPGDWQKDANLRRCSKAAKGVLMDMLCLMFECEDRGVLATGGVLWSDDEISAAIGGDIAENLACIRELLSKGVLSRNNVGAIFSRRQVREERIRSERSKAGKSGMASRYNKSSNKPLTNTLTKGQQKHEDEVEDEDEKEVEVLKPPKKKPPKVPSPQAIAIYGMYPKKVGKPDALKAIQTALDKFPDVNIAALTEAFADAWRGHDLKFCPYPATWFNRESFNDDPNTWGPNDRNIGTALEKYGAGSRRNAGCSVASGTDIARAAAKRTATAPDLPGHAASEAPMQNAVATSLPGIGCSPP